MRNIRVILKHMELLARLNNKSLYSELHYISTNILPLTVPELEIEIWRKLNAIMLNHFSDNKNEEWFQKILALLFEKELKEIKELIEYTEET